MKRIFIVAVLFTAAIFIFTQCTDEKKADTDDIKPTAAQYGGFESQIKWGEHLVTICGCNDCHTPKKMGERGPEPDMSLMLSGHPSKMPPPPIDRKLVEKDGLAVTQTLTAWVGPWGTTYSYNLTPDSTGIGTWKEEQFFKALREGKWMGLDNTRPIMPPMPWEDYKVMTDDEIKAIFAYLKSIPPIRNVVPEAVLNPPPSK